MRTHTRFQAETLIFCEFDISRTAAEAKCHTGKAAVPDLLPKSHGAFVYFCNQGLPINLNFAETLFNARRKLKDTLTPKIAHCDQVYERFLIP